MERSGSAMLLGCLILAGMFFTGVILGEDAVTSRDIERDVRQRLDRGELSGDDVDMALSYCEEVFSERQEDVSFLKLYGELLLVGSEERGGTDLSSLVLEEAVAVYDRQLRLMQHKALTGSEDCGVVFTCYFIDSYVASYPQVKLTRRITSERNYYNHFPMNTF